MSARKRQPSTRRPPPSLQQAFLAASTKGDLAEQVRLARTEARALVWEHGVDGDNIEAIGDLAGDLRPAVDDHTRRVRAFDPVAGAEWTAYCHHLNAAFALGIAIGQLVSPDVFKPGGGR